MLSFRLDFRLFLHYLVKNWPIHYISVLFPCLFYLTVRLQPEVRVGQLLRFCCFQDNFRTLVKLFHKRMNIFGTMKTWNGNVLANLTALTGDEICFLRSLNSFILKPLYWKKRKTSLYDRHEVNYFQVERNHDFLL